MNRFVKKLIAIWRKPLIDKYHRSLKQTDAVIISSNCIGGVMYHDTKTRFLSPTINLSILDFLSFVDSLERNLKSQIVPAGFDSLGRPLCKINGIVLKGHHYLSEKEMILKWEERSKRALGSNKIYIVTTDEFIKSEDDEKRFDSINYPKICFTSKKPKYDWQIYLPEFKNSIQVGDCMKYKTISGKRIFEKHFDFVGWLNSYYN